MFDLLHSRRLAHQLIHAAAPRLLHELVLDVAGACHNVGLLVEGLLVVLPDAHAGLVAIHARHTTVHEDKAVRFPCSAEAHHSLKSFFAVVRLVN